MGSGALLDAVHREVLDGPVPPAVAVHHLTPEVTEPVEGEGEHRGRVGHGGDGCPAWRDGERRGGRIIHIVLGEAGGVVLLEDEGRAGPDVGALILVGELDGGVELGEFDRGHAVTQSGDAWMDI